MSYGERLRVAWLVFWRAAVILLVLSDPIARLFLPKALSLAPETVQSLDVARALLKIAVVTLAVFCLIMPWAAGSMLRKKFHGFHLAIVPDIAGTSSAFSQNLRVGWFLAWRFAIGLALAWVGWLFTVAKLMGLLMTVLGLSKGLKFFLAMEMVVPGGFFHAPALVLFLFLVAPWLMSQMMAKNFWAFHIGVRRDPVQSSHPQLNDSGGPA